MTTVESLYKHPGTPHLTTYPPGIRYEPPPMSTRGGVRQPHRSRTYPINGRSHGEQVCAESVRGLFGQRDRRQLEPPDRAMQEHGPLEPHEGWHLSYDKPVVQVGGLLAQHRGNKTGEPAELQLHEVARHGLGVLAQPYGLLALGRECHREQ